MNHKQFIIATIFFKKEEDNRWTGECKEFGTATFGDSLEEAKQNIIESLDLHLTCLEEAGELERFIKENNIQVHTERLHRKETQIDAPIDSNIFSQPYIHELCEA